MVVKRQDILREVAFKNLFIAIPAVIEILSLSSTTNVFSLTNNMSRFKRLLRVYLKVKLLNAFTYVLTKT